MDGGDRSDDALIELPIHAGTRPRRSDPPPRKPGSKTRPVVVAIVLVVLGVVGANIVLGGGDSDDAEEAASDDQPLADLDPALLEARPDASYTDLSDGQIVRYELDSLPFSVDTVTVVCLSDTGATSESLLDECDSGTAHRHTSSPGGVIETDVTVYRQIAVGGFRRLDCAETGCELRTYAEQAAGSVVGRATLAWADEPTERLGPQITVDFDDRPFQGATFSVTGSGFPADTPIRIQPCSFGTDPDPFTCTRVFSDDEIVTEADGTFHHDDIADWVVGFGSDVATCAELETGVCAISVTIDGAERQPAAAPLRMEVNRFADDGPPLPDDLVIEPSAGLRDGDLVSIRGEGIEPGGEVELFICAEAEAPVDCTWLDFAGRAGEGVFRVPRAFLTWRGTRHDCVLDGPCTVSVFSFRDRDERLNISIEFDPDAELQTAEPVTVTPTTDLEDFALLTLDFEQLVTVPFVSVCAVDSNVRCEQVSTRYTTGDQLVARARPALTTPDGLHNCITDGPCELVVWDAATLMRFETTPLSFAPVDQRPLQGVARPATGIEHGDTVQIAIVDAADDVSVSMCRVGGPCVALMVSQTTLSRATIEFTAMQVFEVPLADGTLQRVDCAAEPCEVRVSDGWAADAIEVTFADSSRPAAQLAIGADEPLALDERVTVRGRGFTPTVQPLEIRLLLCPPWAELDSSCVQVGTVATQGLRSDGAFELPFIIPSSAFTTGFQNAMDRCGRECDLVARPSYGESVKLPIVRETAPVEHAGMPQSAPKPERSKVPSGRMRSAPIWLLSPARTSELPSGSHTYSR